MVGHQYARVVGQLALDGDADAGEPLHGPAIPEVVAVDPGVLGAEQAADERADHDADGGEGESEEPPAAAEEPDHCVAVPDGRRQFGQEVKGSLRHRTSPKGEMYSKHDG